MTTCVVVDPAGDRAALARTLGSLPDAFRVVVARPWPQAPSGPVAPGVQVVDVPGRGPARAANGALAVARAGPVLVLLAGDRLLAGGDALARAADGLLVLGIADPDRDALRDAWTGPWPPVAPRTVRLAGDAGVWRALDGFDDRVADLDVAALDLLARAGGMTWQQLPGAVAVAAEDPWDRARRQGRAARTLEHAGPPVEAAAGRTRTTVTLRWAGPLLRRRAGSAPGGRVGRLALRSAFAAGRVLPAPAPVAGERLGLDGGARPDRPAVAVVVPFAGSVEEAEVLVDALAGLDRRDGDEVLVVDNSERPVVPGRAGVRVIHAAAEGSSYFARNVGMRSTTAPWVLFIDGDCRPAPGLLDGFFAPAPPSSAGALAGMVLDHPGDSLGERLTSALGVLSQAHSLLHPFRPYAVTANLCVRREAWESVGGFAQGARSGADADFCWRLQEAGWSLELRGTAAVLHQHRTTIRGLLRQYRRYGAGRAWLQRRWPEAPRDWPALRLRDLRAPLVDLVAARPAQAAARTAWLLTTAAALRGTFDHNRPARCPGPQPARLVAVAQRWPAPAADGASRVAVEADARPRAASPVRLADVDAHYREDDAVGDLIAAATWALGTRGAAAWRAFGRPRELAADATVARRVLARDAVEIAPLEPGHEPAAARVAALAGVKLRPGT